MDCLKGPAKLLLLLWTVSSFASEVCFYTLEEVENWEWSLESTSERHSVYFNEDFYCKIWGKDPDRCSHFYTLYEERIFHEIAPLTALIFDEENLCRGYITKKCAPLVPDVDFTCRDMRMPYSQVKNPKAFTLFLHKFVEIFEATGYIFSDITRRVNFGKYGDRYYLIDLDDIYTIKQLRARMSQKQVDLHLKNYAGIRAFYLEYCD